MENRSLYYSKKYIYTNLHLPVKIIAKDKGRGSIQINGLSRIFKKKSSSERLRNLLMSIP